MYPLETIQAMNTPPAHSPFPKPWYPETGELIVLLFSQPGMADVPFLGSYVPPGWRLTGKQWNVSYDAYQNTSKVELGMNGFAAEAREWFYTHPTCGFAVIASDADHQIIAAYEYVGVS